jgi:hypothetical protein
LENCVFSSVHSSNLPFFFIKNPNSKYHKRGRKKKNPQQEGGLNQSNNFFKILEICPTIVQSVHNIIGNKGIFHFVCLLIFYLKGSCHMC